ncbi:copper chaperone PCu(A)C [uncultured Brevibacterium sp.]|uniref:copper chaperone PCu(A)C n=1 Tax=uncultured Brevibacterium sp. TaxID=189678 RepID=UPI0025D7C308|nr:copper chaperone PCu(A)C [uncultured Brevibacterium sp.]
MYLKKLALIPVAVVAGSALALAGCGSSKPENQASTSAHEEANSSPVETKDMWIKAAKDGMTAAFGTVTNTSGEDLTLTGGKSGHADVVEMHETVSDGAGGMEMKHKEDGFTIKPGESKTFEPGGDHIMLMKMTKAIEPGEKITITVTSSQGDIPLEFTAKEFTGAKENYAPGDHGDHSEHGGHGDHAGHGDHGEGGDEHNG